MAPEADLEPKALLSCFHLPGVQEQEGSQLCQQVCMSMAAIA